MLSGIALGTIVALAVYHLARAVAPTEMRDDGAVLVVGGPATQHDDDIHGHRRRRER